MRSAHEAILIFLVIIVVVSGVRPSVSSGRLSPATGQPKQRQGHATRECEGPLTPSIEPQEHGHDGKGQGSVADIDMDIPDNVGIPYQEPTPLLTGHRDVKESRDANSYAAEAARCLNEVMIYALQNHFVFGSRI
jgi:hypothetical protein